MMTNLQLGVSRCLLGHKVRFDGKDKFNTYIHDVLGRYFHLFPMCPEVDAGLTTPRKPISLVGDPLHPRVVTVEDIPLDVTDRLYQYATQTVPELRMLCGFVLKAKSPSCGLSGIPIYDDKRRIATGQGVFASHIKAQLPQLPLIDEERLRCKATRRLFLAKVFAYARHQHNSDKI